MSVYKPAKSQFWQYDFVQKGRRFHGSTGQLTRRKAEEVERKRRYEAAMGMLGAVASMTLDEAAGRYWQEVGKDRGDSVDVERRIEQLIRIMGRGATLGDIGQGEVATAIETRRGMFRVRSIKPGAKAYAPKNATVNRDIIETLRPILRRARTHWTPKGQSHGLPEIAWRELRMSEPRGLSRIYNADQRQAWASAAENAVEGDDIALAADMLNTYGLRLGELLFPLDALDLSTLATGVPRPTLRLQKGRKKDVILYLPLRLDHARQLAARVTRARSGGLDTVWLHEVFRVVKGEQITMVEALNYNQLEYRLSKAADKAGITGPRRIHGARHSAASHVLARTKNLKAVQSLLGHASIQSSQRYAHMDIDALRAAVEDELPAPSSSSKKPRLSRG